MRTNKDDWMKGAPLWALLIQLAVVLAGMALTGYWLTLGIASLVDSGHPYWATALLIAIALLW